MNLFNLILIVIIMFITMDPIMTVPNFAWDRLVFIKPENLTKTELVEKFKELSSSKSLNDLKNIKNENKKDEDKITIKEFLKTYYLRFSSFIFKFKNLITKIALFTILIKYFRKIRVMKFIFRIINYIFISTFGIFISDIYGFKEIIIQIENYWMKYVNFIHETKIYKTLIKIFHVVIDIDENKSEVVKDNSKIIENKSEVIEDNSKIVENKSESKIVNYEIPSSGGEFKTEKIDDDKISENNKRANWFEVKTYFLIGISIITLAFVYTYWDSIYDFFKNSKPDFDGDETTTTETPIFLEHEEEYKKYFKEISTNEELYDLEVIKNQNKEKVVDYSDVENIKWEDSPTTPKASSSKLPERDAVMIPFSKK